MRQQLITMLEMQERMNLKIHADWIGQRFAWHRALWIECGELIEHHGYKWWKKQEPDWEHVRLEVVDIWHFGMSMRFDGRNTPEQIADEMLEELRLDPPPALPLLEAVEAMVSSVLVERRFPMSRFWPVMVAAGLDGDRLFTAYVGKNVLNFFRQDNGYKDGSYRKQWAGKEDNEHLSELMKCLDNTDSAFPTRLYEALAERYLQSQGS